jgi:small subunit ribosomal protein S9
MVAVKKDKFNGDALGTGRRKKSVARVRIRPGSGNITINSRSLEDYFHTERDQQDVVAPLKAIDSRNAFDIIIRVSGGGSSGQSGACKMGVARALLSYDVGWYEKLREGGFLTRDSRMKERKKYGLHAARKGTQFSKR